MEAPPPPPPAVCPLPSYSVYRPLFPSPSRPTDNLGDDDKKSSPRRGGDGDGLHAPRREGHVLREVAGLGGIPVAYRVWHQQGARVPGVLRVRFAIITYLA